MCSPSQCVRSTLISSSPGCPANGDVSCVTVEVGNVEEKQAINYLHRMAIMMAQQREGTEKTEVS